MDVEALREQFPILGRTVYGKPLLYFDNAATSQRPQAVIDAWTHLSRELNANIHRGTHRLAVEATDAYEAARDTVAAFIHASRREEIVFTSGCTAALNLLAYSLGAWKVREGDEVIVSVADHHSNFVPWQQLCLRSGACLKVLRPDEAGVLQPAELQKLITNKTRIVALPHISNVLGRINPVKALAEVVHKVGALLVVDGAQGIVHCPVNVREMGCDFYAFSGHKVYAATGTGVLYGRYELLDRMPPFLTGGEMVGSVSEAQTTFAPLPYRFEAGTPDFTAASTWTPALETASLMRDAEIEKSFAQACECLYAGLQSRSDLHLAADGRESGIFSFTVEGVHHADLAQLLDKMGVAVRSGQMCAEPMMTQLGVTGLVRASLAPYNTAREAERFLECLDRAVGMLR